MAARPHLYLWDGRWWVSRNGPLAYFGRRELDRFIRITINDLEGGTFSAACALAKTVAALPLPDALDSRERAAAVAHGPAEGKVPE